MERRALVLVILFAFAMGACKEKDAVVKREGQPDFVTKFDEQRMDAAIAEAKGTLGSFEAALEAHAPGTDGFTVKKGFAFGNEGKEFIWVGDVRKADGGFKGSVDNEPVNQVGVKLGEEVLVARGDVVDWMYNQNGKMKGGYTIVALTYGTPEQDEYTKKMGVDWGAYKFLKGAK
jgi:uncharacterized protein YegJ (DUF2314 family)